MRSSVRPTLGAKECAFTIIEILIAVAVIGSLVAIALPSYQSYIERTRVAKAAMEISSISTKLKLYWEDNRQFPPSLSTLFNPVPVDPWGHPYQYLAIDIVPPPSLGAMRKDKFLNPLNSDFDLYSMGKDGRSVKPLTGAFARDDVVRADNGRFIGLASDY